MTRPVAVRLPEGRLHLAGPTGRGYRAACGRQLAGGDLVVHVGRAVGRAWRLELVCLDCDRKAAAALARRRRTR